MKDDWKANPGPWTGEPDSVDIESHGLRCALRRNGMGAWCGYVGIPKEHPLYGVECSAEIKAPKERIERKGVNVGVVPLLFAACSSDASREAGIYRLDVLLDCHGGLTYSGEKWPEDSGLWWLGFDCSHAGDICPGHEHSWEHDEYRDVEYVIEQTKALAAQLAAWPKEAA